MHTFLVILGGVVLLGLVLVIGGLVGPGGAAGMRRAALAFIPVWLVAAVINLWVGASSAVVSVADEFPFFLLVFAAPALVAAAVWWRLGRSPA
ncbi:hypothetical protein ABEG18_18415 [Alsobacter sp. KACC 23698]|uniref:Transmembrane protein n=1 Tax=Alsobacter sp. KACC 23698 TaxID=3149229 RepID=A0AAU7JBN2_9HYPH